MRGRTNVTRYAWARVRNQCILNLESRILDLGNPPSGPHNILMEDFEENTTDGQKAIHKVTFSEDEIVEIRSYFRTMPCTLRVLGSQLGLEPYELDEIEDFSKLLPERKLRLVDECIRKEKLMSWEHLASTLERPAVDMKGLAREIRQKHIYLRQYSSDSTGSLSSPMSPPRSLTSLEMSFSAAMDSDHGKGYET